jgi:tetratricopeptide (TPR) repeat protein
MKFRTVAGPVALALVLAGLPGCGIMKFSSSEPSGKDGVAAGNAAYDKKDYATACRELSKAGAAAGAETLTRAGTACARDGEMKARQAFTTALSANAGFAPAMEGLGLEAFAAGDVLRARDMLEAASRAGGTDPRAALALGDAYLLSGQCDRALAAYQEARKRDAAFAPAGARLDAVRLVCGARKPGPAGANGAPATLVPTAPAGPGPAAVSPPAGGKEAGKPKAAPKTIDLNDI